IGRQDGAPVYLFSTDSPLADATGEVQDMAIYAGQSCGQIHALCSAGERVRQMLDEATACLGRLQGDAMVARAPAPVPPAAARPHEELVGVLQELLDAERAGARVAAPSLREAAPGTQHALLEQISRGEADSCRRL